MKIHPTAIVDKTAKIADDVEIGPYSIIEANVELGAGCVVESHVRIYANAILGKNNRIYTGAVINCEPQDLSFKPGSPRFLKVGDDNIFREHANIHGAADQSHPTRIGNHNYFMGSTHAGHDCIIGDHNIITQGTVVAGHVTIGNHAFISGLVAIHQFCRVGDYAMIGGCSKIANDCPPYVTTDGNPAAVVGLNVIGLRRGGFSPEQRQAIKQAYKVIYHSGMNRSEGVAELKKNGPHGPEVESIIRFFESSERGVENHR